MSALKENLLGYAEQNLSNEELMRSYGGIKIRHRPAQTLLEKATITDCWKWKSRTGMAPQNLFRHVAGCVVSGW